MIRFVVLASLIVLTSQVYSQKGNPALPPVDSARLLSIATRTSCKCIDSIIVGSKTTNEITAAISKCINRQAQIYQGILQLQSVKAQDLQYYYFQVERRLKDSCQSMNQALKSNNKESATSMSKDIAAVQQYNIGVEWMNKDSVVLALSWFQKAVNSDPQFAFAWDNIGIINRQLGKYDDAIYAYGQSLRVDPKGLTPLHNLPIAYQFQKKYDKAVEAYDHLLQLYPDDPEGYWGKGRIFTYFIVDLEKALRNMCKAYNLYYKSNSPYRVDAEKHIGYIYTKMKAEGKEKLFTDILKEYNISLGN